MAKQTINISDAVATTGRDKINDNFTELYDGKAGLDEANTFTSTGDTSFAGNVGIGTTSPDGKLEVDGDFRMGQGQYVDATSIPTNQVLMNLWDTGVSGGYRRTLDIAVRSSSGGGVGGSQVKFWTNGTDGVMEEAMIIDRNGSIGIGTTTPGSKLAVVGLPTSSAGLSSGDMWRSGTDVKIVD